MLLILKIHKVEPLFQMVFVLVLLLPSKVNACVPFLFPFCRTKEGTKYPQGSLMLSLSWRNWNPSQMRDSWNYFVVDPNPGGSADAECILLRVATQIPFLLRGILLSPKGNKANKRENRETNLYGLHNYWCRVIKYSWAPILNENIRRPGRNTSAFIIKFVAFKERVSFGGSHFPFFCL